MKGVVKILVSLALAASAALAAETGLLERGADLAARNVNRAAAAVQRAMDGAELQLQARSNADVEAEAGQTQGEASGSGEAGTVGAQGEASASGEVSGRSTWKWLLQALPGVSFGVDTQTSGELTVAEALRLELAGRLTASGE